MSPVCTALSALIPDCTPISQMYKISMASPQPPLPYGRMPSSFTTANTAQSVASNVVETKYISPASTSANMAMSMLTESKLRAAPRVSVPDGLTNQTHGMMVM